VVTCKRQLAVGVDGRNDYRSRTLALPLGRHRNLVGGSNKGKIRGKQRSGLRQKREVRAQNSKAHDDVSINGVFPGWASFLKKCQVITRENEISDITRLLPLKRQRHQAPLGRYL
jgi:hypothetical protein